MTEKQVLHYNFTRLCNLSYRINKKGEYLVNVNFDNKTIKVKISKNEDIISVFIVSLNSIDETDLLIEELENYKIYND